MHKRSLIFHSNKKIIMLMECSFKSGILKLKITFVKSRWQQKTCYLSAWISQKKDRQTQHYFLSKAVARQFDLPSRLSVTMAKVCCRKFPFVVVLRNYDSKILLTQFLMSSEGCIGASAFLTGKFNLKPLVLTFTPKSYRFNYGLEEILVLR